MNKKCATLIIEELPGLVCYIKQNFCSPEMSELTMQQHRLMSQLLNRELSPSLLAADLSVSLPAVSRMIQPLINSGWIQKKISAEDKRNSILTLTNLGTKTLSQSRKESHGKLSLAIDKLSQKEKKTIIEAFEILETLKTSI